VAERARLPALGLALLLSVSSLPVAASPDWETPAAADRKGFTPYLDGADLTFHVLAGPPVAGSKADQDDVAGILRRQTETSEARWRTAEDDADRLYDRFSEAFGGKLDRQERPFTIRLLNRLERTVGKPTFAAKDLYQRARPYQRMKLTRVCGKSSAPDADPDVAKRTSYPSGHSAYGWTAALVLADLAPDRAEAVLGRGMDYGESRLVCGVHFPSDVEAGRLIAMAVYERARATAAFKADFACAKAERRKEPGDEATLAACRVRLKVLAG
jgi:acid phosphatase (class A)